MRTVKNNDSYTSGSIALAIMAGWSDPEPSGLTADDRWQIVSTALRSVGVADPRPAPQHHALEALAAEVADVQERDFAARVTFHRSARHV
jgi:hypothetical protein